MKYVEPLRNARDWLTFAAPGPGSERGLNRILGRPVDKGWKDDDWRFRLRELHGEIKPELERTGLGDLHAQDLQNCLCEFDKYERARLGEGKPKRRFAPRAPDAPEPRPGPKPRPRPAAPLGLRRAGGHAPSAGIKSQF